jgi:hypothetical protein
MTHQRSNTPPLSNAAAIDMKLRAVGAAERAAIVLRDQIDGVWLAFHCGELGKATAAVMQALYLVLADQINKDSDRPSCGSGRFPPRKSGLRSLERAFALRISNLEHRGAGVSGENRSEMYGRPQTQQKGRSWVKWNLSSRS